MANKIDLLDQANLREKPLAAFDVGDTVEVKFKIESGAKSKIQRFVGIVIKKQHGGIQETFTVRRVVAGEGVERSFPLHARVVIDIKVTRKAKVRRAKLFYLRGRSGKKARLKQKLGEKKE